MAERLNEYRFTSVAALRAAFRSYRQLEAEADVASATILLDLRQALESPILTQAQRKAIQLLLLDDLKDDDAAKVLGISKRRLYQSVRAGLESLMHLLNTGQTPKTPAWKPEELEVLKNPFLSPEQIAIRLGRTVRAVEVAMSRYRDRESIPYRAKHRSRSGSTFGGQPAA